MKASGRCPLKSERTQEELEARLQRLLDAVVEGREAEAELRREMDWVGAGGLKWSAEGGRRRPVPGRTDRASPL